ncbi:MAG: PKD repeat protein [Planctomycetota bacterium]
MRAMPSRAYIATLLFLSCLVLSLPAQEFGRRIPSGIVDSGLIHKVVISRSDAVTLDSLDAIGAIVDRIEYASYTLAFVAETAWSSREAMVNSGIVIRDDFDLMVFNGYMIHGARPLEFANAIPLDEAYGNPAAADLASNAGLYVVQFRGPVKDEWIKELTAIGASIVQFAPSNGYVVRLAPNDVPLLIALKASMKDLQYAGAYHPGYKMRPAIRQVARSGSERLINVTVQIVRSASLNQSREFVESLMSQVEEAHVVGPYLNVKGSMVASRFHVLARHPDVFAIEPNGKRTRSDERQGQIIAGNYSGSQPSGPGYLSWLASKGFDSSQFSSFAVNVVDDAMSLLGHADLPNSRVVFGNNPTNQTGSEGGHGFLNANIVAGFNNGTGSAFEDALGYNYGLGIAPWARVGSTAIFGGTSSSPTSWENTAYSQGARISTNSWNFQSGQFGNPIPTYDANAQEYDFIVRDARSGVAGNQQYMVLFSASNSGPQANTVSTPTTAKNILSVGASENYRPTGTDGCGISNSGADNFNDIISFSSRGPVDDGRWKPEIVAPGTHIQAGIPQSNYAGTSVCEPFFPSGQTLYSWSSGTSHSAPGVAGGAALVRQWFLNNSMSAPSPAMTKAVIIGGAEYLTGVSANDTLPSNSQGMGLMNLGRSFDAGSKILVDQNVVLPGSGASHQVTGSVANSANPFRVTLAWTDAPGTSTSAPWVNNLDLQVTVGGNTYRGNVFSGAHSSTGGSADFRNNVESVFLPAGVSGPFTITITGTSIGGDGIPGNADSTDQDFALYVHNGTEVSIPPTAAFVASPTSGSAPLTVNFSDQSTGTISTWSWNFGDGNTSTSPNPTHNYTTVGSFDVSLTLTGPSGSDVHTKLGYVTTSAPLPPAAPSALNANPTSSSAIDIGWSDNSGDEDGFNIERSADGVNFSSHDSTGANTSSYSDVGLAENTTYWYRVEAFNASGSSGYSNSANATTLMAGAIDYLTTSEIGGQGTVTGSYLDTHVDDNVTQSIQERLSGGKPARRHSYLNHTWTFNVAPAGSLTFMVRAWHSVSNDSDDFAFEWSSDNVSFSSMVVATATSDAAIQLSFSLPNNLSGTVYVRVIDTNQSQGNQGLDFVFIDEMLIRSAGVGVFPPSAPDGLGASVQSPTSVSIGWNDNSTDEDGFELERSTDGVNFASLVVTAANVNSHLDSGLTSGQIYFYRVRAFNSNGNSSFSGTASATPGGGGGGAIDDVAQSETSIDGAIQSGSFATTATANGLSESIHEDRTGGPPSSRVTLLEHNWNFQVTGGSSVAFHLKAFKSSSSDNDDFEFLYSIDGGSNFVSMLVVSNTTDVGTVTFAMPSNTSGSVIVKVIDTDRNTGSSSRDIISVDHMFFRSQ